MARTKPTRRTRVHAARVRGALARIPAPLALLLACGALLAIGWDLSLPAFQGPDEPAHFGYVQHLAETGTAPNAATGESPNSTEVHDALLWLNLQPLTGNLSAKPAWSTADLKLWRQAVAAEPKGSRANGSGANAIAKNPPLYYALMAIPYRVFVWLPLLKRIFILRLFNALCYLATIALMWLIAGEIFGPVRWKQTLAAGVVALEPQLAYMSAVINADNLLIALTTAFMLAAIRLVRHGPSMRRVLTAAVLCAAAFLTHGRGLVTVPVFAVGLCVAWIVHRPGRRESLQRASAALGTLVFAALAYLTFGRSPGGGGAYGGQVSGLNSTSSFNIRQFLSSIYQFYFPKLSSLQPRLGPEYGYRQVFIDTFYGTFGSLEVVFRARLYDTLQVFSALGLVGLYTACVVRFRRLLRDWPLVLLMLTLLITQLAFLHYVSYQALLSNKGADPLIVGRYLLPMISLFGLAIAFTVGSLPRRLGQPLAAVILSAGILLSLAGIGITAARFYA